MDEKQKKQINEAIAVLKKMCNENMCGHCPSFNGNCFGTGRFCHFPGAWQDIG